MVKLSHAMMVEEEDRTETHDGREQMNSMKCIGLSVAVMMVLVGCGGGGTSVEEEPIHLEKQVSLNQNRDKKIVLLVDEKEIDFSTYKLEDSPKHGLFDEGQYTPEKGYVGEDGFTLLIVREGLRDLIAQILVVVVADFDGDNIADIEDNDDDGDGVADAEDAFPLDSTETVDTDGDGIGNSADNDDDGDGISDLDEIANGTDPLVPNPLGGRIRISGKVEYEKVNPLHTGNESRLDFNNISIEPAKEVIVKAINSSEVVIATTTTNSRGEYTLVDLPKESRVKIRVYAKMLNGAKWDVKVVDNINQYAQYVLEGNFANTGSVSSIRNLKALAFNRSSAPFAILDAVYKSMQKVLASNSGAIFPPLKMNWTVKNIESGTYYDGKDNIMIQGDQNGDSDEYDDHIIVHEWGHYFESQFSRSDSIGGPHGGGESIDIRLAFGEGFGNALSAIVTDDPIYFDSYYHTGWNMNIEQAAQVNSGWFSESSIQRILYDLYDEHDDGEDRISLGFKPLYDVFVGAQKRTPAFTSIFSFITALKRENSLATEAIDDIVSSEQIATILDIYGKGRTNRASSYPYFDYLNLGDTLSFSTSNSDGGSQSNDFNKLSNRKYIKFTIPVEANYTIDVRQTNGTDADPDFFLYGTSPFKIIRSFEGVPNNGQERGELTLKAGEYLLDVVNWNRVNAKFNIKIE
jgi:hypothetical protein